MEYVFKKELKELIKKHSLENESDTPDYVLAEYILSCLYAYENAIKARDRYFNVDMWADDKRKHE
jgi:hypothetical protein